MKLVFSGLENSLELTAGETSVLQVENSALFARIASSLRRDWGARRWSLTPFGRTM